MGAIYLIAMRGNGVHSVTYMPGTATVVGHHSFLREEPHSTKDKSAQSQVVQMATVKQYQFVELLLSQKGIDQSDTAQLNQVGIHSMNHVTAMTYNEIAQIIENLKRLKTPRRTQHQQTPYKLYTTL